MPCCSIFDDMKPIMLPFCSFERSIFNENPRMKRSSADPGDILPFILLSEVSSVENLPFVLVYEADLAAILPFLHLHKADSAAI